MRHVDQTGQIAGWEERGRAWRGYSTGGHKCLFAFEARSAPRVCVTEAAIDALSLAALEEQRPDTLYVSTGGAWSPTTALALRVLAADHGRELVAATDGNRQGDGYAVRLEQLACEAGASFLRRRPCEQDWNDELCVRMSNASA